MGKCRKVSKQSATSAEQWKDFGDQRETCTERVNQSAYSERGKIPTASNPQNTLTILIKKNFTVIYIFGRQARHEN